MITGKTPVSGNNVSHALNRTRRRFMPNIQQTTLFSEALNRNVKMRLTARGLRTVDHKGGLDAFILGTALTKLDPSLRPLKAQIQEALAKKAS